jgi:hypothetical protein
MDRVQFSAPRLNRILPTYFFLKLEREPEEGYLLVCLAMFFAIRWKTGRKAALDLYFRD